MFAVVHLRSPATLLVLGLLMALAWAAGAGGVVTVQQGAAPLTIRPLPGDDPLLPMSALRFAVSRPVAAAEIRVEPPAPGRLSVEGRTLTFRPTEPLRPGTRYRFHVEVRDADGRTQAASFERTVGGADMLWVYVELDKELHWVHVFRGDERVRRMLASGGRPGDETPEGTFRIQNRGYHFWSEKYQEGAYYWVRIYGNYLFHSVPVDIHGRVIAEEARRLGCPASHGCVRLGMEDARWFYEHVPDGTLVVIDRT